jgi:hypothetical protein
MRYQTALLPAFAKGFGGRARLGIKTGLACRPKLTT